MLESLVLQGFDMPRKTNPLPDLKRLEELFCYEPETGLLRSRVKRPKVAVGSVVGTKNNKGHLICRVKYKIYYVHRIVWMLHYRSEPPAIIDHINGDGCDNRISNLRPASLSQNMANSGANKATSSNLKGAHWSNSAQRWRSSINRNGKIVHLGWFGTKEEAAEAYKAASVKVDGAYSYYER